MARGIRHSAAQRRRRVAAYRASGLSQIQCSKDQGISTTTLGRWLREFPEPPAFVEGVSAGVGAEGGDESAATWCSLIGNCMLNAVDPWLYLNDVLPKLGDWPVNRVLELEPVAWRIRRLSEAR